MLFEESWAILKHFLLFLLRWEDKLKIHFEQETFLLKTNVKSYF